MPIDKAIDNLYEFLSNIYSESTKSTSGQKPISSIVSIKFNQIRTKSEIKQFDTENLVYLINFEDENGYAMVSADNRIEEDVIIYVENGSLYEKDLIKAFPDVGKSVISTDFPTDGPGIVLDENGEKHINPNTFDPYDEKSGDTYIGDITLADISEPREVSDVELAIAVRSLEYSYDKVAESIMADRITEIDEDRSNVDIKTEYSDYRKSNIVKPILDSLSFWHQGHPFNRHSP